MNLPQTSTSEFTEETPNDVPLIPLEPNIQIKDSSADTVDMQPISYRIHSGRPDGNALNSSREPKSQEPVINKSCCCILL
ncbi:hypothetical protein TVAG_264230 [Trichomonas vaginalis G3]|uniref:Uncharacterized protein n=1 Tax=Trichomonas vaginalis (strain ATCC PRA-98 / G3) TaxID=412133 RepID=A2FFM0_TRIV3|nr:hypothetical protein TVAGG3_1007940 [Trichomonas vaginalis G3]EAX96299.1 hypothetical protein TVAG_264230 [Trichomonas vaginalis G3]KAI5491266.1 hypothetical protein TVAGG3_1007940 [Trichomonas vaginalis G3]|eukprot:XP_001309229.1 hypothetical protein [Trichomonas vaginalis G3]